MIVLDSLLVGGIRFVLDKVAQAVDTELNDDNRLREELLAAQMQLELGEIDEEEFAAREADLLARLRAISEARRAAAAEAAEKEGKDGGGPGEYRIAGIEASFAGGHEGER